jgi:hypothetical protein
MVKLFPAGGARCLCGLWMALRSLMLQCVQRPRWRRWQKDVVWTSGGGGCLLRTALLVGTLLFSYPTMSTGIVTIPDGQADSISATTSNPASVHSSQHHHVQVYHYVIHYWGKSYEGPQDCGPNLTCEWMFADNLKTLRAGLDANTSIRDDSITVSLYNIHSWWERHRDHRPAICELPSNLTMVESEESRTRYHGLFDPSFKHFDGFSSTHPTAHVQRIYLEAYLNESEFLPMKPFSSLVKAAAYVASDCHKRDNANANRDSVVKALKQNGLRVDGLGRCMHSIGPEGFSLPNTPEARYNLTIKRDVISNFQFYLAFENSIEPGYVTEKPFDGLLAGMLGCY